MIARTSDEREILREGGKRLAAVLKRIAQAAVPGVSTDELDRLAERLIRDGGDEPAFLHYTPEGADRPYPATLCTSINDVIVHGIPNEHPEILKEGDIIGLDLGVRHKGLITDAAVSVIVGKGDAEAKRLVRTTREALEAGVSAVRAGGHIGDIGAAVMAVAKREGYSMPKELGGHAVGYRVHELPYVPNEGKRGTGEELTEGMVIAIEPMLCEGKGSVSLDEDGYTIRTRDGKRSAHFEHTVIVAADGAEVLTR